MKTNPICQYTVPIILLATLLAGCSSARATDLQPAAVGTPGEFTISSPAFEAGRPIPDVYTCQGDDTSPPLDWSPPPPGTASLALVMDDPDAPGRTWVHWIVYNLPPDSGGLPKGEDGAFGKSILPPQAVSGANSWRRSGYGGPCPPSGEHRYFFRLYALDTTLPAEDLDKAGLLNAIDGHVLGQAEFYGTYQK